MRFRRELPEHAPSLGPGKCLFRSLLVVGLTALIALAVLVRPLQELPGPLPALDLRSTAPAQTVAVSPTSEAATLVLPTEAPAETSTTTPRSTFTPTATATPSPVSSPAPTSTSVPSPTAMPSDTPVAVATVAPQPTTPVPLAGRVEQGVYYSQVTGREESYRVYLPPGYDEVDRRYPVLYLLHGWPYDERHWDNLGVDEIADARIVNGTLPPLIIVLPGADPNGVYVNTSGGAQSFEQQLVNELMPHIDAGFRSVQTREARAIGGISRGGVWALEIAFQHPDAFAIVGAHSPALSANRAPPAYDPFVLVDQPGVQALRIYLSAGDVDWAREATSQLHQALDEKGIASQFVVHSGAHVDQLWAQHIDEYLTFYAAGW